MTTWVCVNRQRDRSGVITGYTLQNTETMRTVFEQSDNVKIVLQKGKDKIINLKLTSDDRLILVKPEFQDAVDKTNKQYKSDINITKYLEEQVDKFMQTMLKFRQYPESDRVVRLLKLDTTGDINTFILTVNNSILLGAENSRITFRYRKNIVGHNGSTYRAKIQVQLVSVGTSKHTEVASGRLFETEAFEFNSVNNKISCDINKTTEAFMNYINTVCKEMCIRNGISKGSLNATGQKYGRSMKIKSAKTLVACAMLLACTAALAGCSSSETAGQGGSSGGAGASLQYQPVTQYSETTEMPDYTIGGVVISDPQMLHHYNLTRTVQNFEVMHTTLRDINVTIEANYFYDAKAVDFCIKDNNQQVIAEQIDKADLNSDNFVHEISVAGQLEATTVRGNASGADVLYIMGADGTQSEPIAVAKFTGSGSKMTIQDRNGNTIAEAQGALGSFKNASIKILDNDTLQDEALLLIIQSYASDREYEVNKSKTSYTYNGNRNTDNYNIIKNNTIGH